MESIKKAAELARADANAPHVGAAVGSVNGVSRFPEAQIADVNLDSTHLEANRIVAFAKTSQYGRSYDMLRTQVLQEMDRKNWQFLAVTSPTANCGKTVTACNLAMSIARLPERSVLLVDLDMGKPMVASYLGIEGRGGVLSVIEGHAPLSSVVVNGRVGPYSLNILPGSSASAGSSDWMASQTMTKLLDAIKKDFSSRIIIVDLPPMLVGDDVISVLPRMDAVLLVTGVGSTSLADVKECQKHLQRTPVVRVVVNKITERTESYYDYY